MKTARKTISSILAFVICHASYAQGVTITPGAYVVINNNGNVVVNEGSIINNGTFSPGTGTVTISGTSAGDLSIGGSSTSSFYNLTINRSSGGARLLGNIDLSNQVLMTSGNIDLNGFDLNLGPSGFVVGEGADSYITTSSSGFLISTADLIAPSAVNPGNIGLELTSAANLGTTTIKRGHQKPESTTGYGINRFFDIIPTNNAALDATLKFYYLDAELAGINEAELKQWFSPDNGVTWTLLGAEAQDASENFVTKNSINSLGRFTLGSSINNALPLLLLAFNGQLLNNNVLITWSTAYQVNTDHFELQRSADGRNFTAVTTVFSGNSATARAYSYTDRNPFSGIQFYRLKSVDKDGSFSYSAVVAVNKGMYANTLVSVSPNPANVPLHVRFISSSAIKVVLQITDMKGIVVLNKEFTAEKGLNEIICNMSHLAQGSYFLRMPGIDNRTIQIFKY